MLSSIPHPISEPFPIYFPGPSASCPAGSLVLVVTALSCLLIHQLFGTLPSRLLSGYLCLSPRPSRCSLSPQGPCCAQGSKITQLGETSAAGFAVSIASKPRDRYSREAGPGVYRFAQWVAPAAPSTRRATAAGSAAEVSKCPTPDPLRLGALRLGESVFCCPEMQRVQPWLNLASRGQAPSRRRRALGLVCPSGWGASAAGRRVQRVGTCLTRRERGSRR